MDIKYDNINNYNIDDYTKFYNLLNTFDKNKINILVNKDRQKQYILARILLTNILKNKYHLDYLKENIKYNNYGKPYIANINFNISHSHDYVIVATSNNNIGIDIEKIRKVKLTTMNQFCTENEKQYILKSRNKYLSFWMIYTLKEAYFKMLGTDILNMKKVEFNIHDDKIICINNPNLKILISKEIKDYIFSIISE